jgi:hypothetical protein
LSLTIIAGRPRRAITAASSRTTRRPPIELSTTRASASRVKSSTNQRWFGPCGMVIGARAPVARLRPRRAPHGQSFLAIEPVQLLIV